MQHCGREPDSALFALRIIPSIMLNCRPPNLAGQAAPDGEHEAADTRGRESGAPCGGAAGRTKAGPASATAQAATKGTKADRSHQAGCEASGGVRVRHGAARPEPQALGPVFWGEGRRGGVRVETEGTALSEAAEGNAQVAKAVLWP